MNIHGKIYMLPLKEFELLHLLAEYTGQVFSREQLIEQIWGAFYEGDERTVDVHIKRLRTRFTKLTDAFSIKTVWSRLFSGAEIMKSLYVKFVVMTLGIMILSFFIAFVVSNAYYQYNLKDSNDAKIQKSQQKSRPLSKKIPM